MALLEPIQAGSFVIGSLVFIVGALALYRRIPNLQRRKKKEKHEDELLCRKPEWDQQRRRRNAQGSNPTNDGFALWQGQYPDQRYQPASPSPIPVLPRPNGPPQHAIPYLSTPPCPPYYGSSHSVIGPPPAYHNGPGFPPPNQRQPAIHHGAAVPPPRPVQRAAPPPLARHGSNNQVPDDSTDTAFMMQTPSPAPLHATPAAMVSPPPPAAAAVAVRRQAAFGGPLAAVASSHAMGGRTPAARAAQGTAAGAGNRNGAGQGHGGGGGGGGGVMGAAVSVLLDRNAPLAVPPPAANQGARGGQLLPDCSSFEIDYSSLSLGEVIGEGAFGRVYKGVWRGTAVAIKVLLCQAMDAALTREFAREVAFLSSLRHPNICLFMGAVTPSAAAATAGGGGAASPSPPPPPCCLVTELVKNGSLWAVMHGGQHTITWELAMSMARDTARGMLFLHSAQPPILHRDLKSANLLVDSAYTIKLTDFGLARVKAAHATMTGNRGTFQWMAPEVLAGTRYTESADVFSFGVVCWELLLARCGAPGLPYTQLHPMTAAIEIVNNGLRPTIPSLCPPAFRALLEDCWCADQEQRPSFSQILAVLENS